MYLDRASQVSRSFLANRCQDRVRAKAYTRLEAETLALQLFASVIPTDRHHGIESLSSEDGEAVIMYANVGDSYGGTVVCTMREDDPLFFWCPRFTATTMGDAVEQLEHGGHTFA